MAKTYNDALEWAAKWIEDTLRAGPETDERTIEFGKNMAMTLRAAKLSDADLPRATADVWLDEIEAACNALLLDVYDLSVANAPISAEYARQTVDCVAHRVGRIRESIGALTAPRATGETTVEAVEKELRELWPNCSFQIREENNAGFYKPAQRHFEIGVISTDYEIHDERFEGATLADCMAQVCAAARTKAERGRGK
jgi:hypothetical protein